MVDIAKRHGGNMTYFGGGEISVREMNEATQRGVPVRLVQGDAVKPNSAKVSKRIEKDPKFVAEPTRSISKRPGLETIGPSQKFAKATPVVAIPSGTSDAQRLERILKTIAQNGCL